MDTTQNVATATTAPAAEIFNSEKLSEIRANLETVTAKLAAGGLATADIIAAAGEIGKLQAAEAAEIANIKKAKLEAELAAAQAKRVSEASDKLNGLIAASEAAKLAAADKKLSIDDKNAANANFVSKFDELVNLFIGKAPKTAVVSGNASKTAKTGASDADIQSAFTMLVASGKSEAEAKKLLEAEPHNFKRSTIWFAIDRLNHPEKYAK